MTTEFFATETRGQTLIVVPQQNVGSMADDLVQPELTALVERLDAAEHLNVVIDFARIDYFGSSMLEALLKLWKHASAGGGAMALCNLSQVEREVLQVSRFETLWPVCESREDALRSVGESI